MRRAHYSTPKQVQAQVDRDRRGRQIASNPGLCFVYFRPSIGNDRVRCQPAVLLCQGPKLCPPSLTGPQQLEAGHP
jgi:hypothetical protein